MDLELTADQQAFRNEVRSWLEANVPTAPLPAAGTDEGFAAHVAWERRLAAAGYAAIHWPVEYGGRGAGPVEQAVFEEEYLAAGGPDRVTVVGHNLFGPTLMRYGTDEQKQRWLPAILAAEEIWTQGYSEPEAGSDLAGLKTRAVRDGDDFVVNGQKIWTSYGAWGDWIFVLVRTDPAAPRHGGISMLAVAMDTPGIEVRPIRQLDGHTGFAEVFFTDVRVPADQLIGAENDGWRVAMTALEFERDAPAAAPARYHRDLAEVAAIARARGLLTDPVVRDELARLAVAVDAYEHHAERTLATLVAGGDLGPLSSLTKLAWSELELDLYRTGRELLGPAGEAIDRLPGLADADAWRSRYWYARAATIYAGTSEIQLGIIAQRVLGLPRRADGAPRDQVVPPLDVRFTDEQAALRDVAREAFPKLAPPSRLRSRYHDGDDDAQASARAWEQIAELGIPTITVPAEHGGYGGSLLDVVLVLEEAGRACLPEPLVDTVAVAAPVLAARGGYDELLAEIVAGDSTIGLAMHGGRLVADVDRHAHVLERHGDALRLVPRAAWDGAVRVPSEDGTRRLFDVSGCDPDRGEVVGGSHLLLQATTLARAATAAELVGVCDHLLAETVAYAKVRRQFDAPIGSFQAVSHELAQMFVVLESARGATRHAARRVAAVGAASLEAVRAADVAKACANVAARRIETSALQLHGGIGFTWEHDLHLWLKRALALQVLHGDTRTLRRAIADVSFPVGPQDEMEAG